MKMMAETSRRRRKNYRIISSLLSTILLKVVLYKDRQQSAPLSQLELDALCPWFKDGDECLLKIDHSFENGRRVIGITSNETLEINAINVNKYFSRVDFLYELTFNIVFLVVDFFYG
jgi:hypothetical protein